jgi:hypothetical protein
VEAMYSLELETSEKITQSKDSKKTKWKALEIIKKDAEEYNSLDSLDNDHAGLAAAALYVARVLEKRDLEMKPSLGVE